VAERLSRAASAEELAPRLLAGDRKAIARGITWVENQDPRAEALLDRVYDKVGRAYRVGVTGPPGAGKSTLTSVLTEHLRRRDLTVGVVAVDPTSPFTGGALLGDRIRMGQVATDPGVFIRSMASRGSLGGIAGRTSEACDVLDAGGFDRVLIETVGVGQSEVDVAKAADTTIVVLSPEAGDAVQAMKAGLMEIADVFCVNKCDRDGADRMVRAIRAMLELGHPTNAAAGDAFWMPPVVKTQARNGEGVSELLEAIEAHQAHLQQHDLLGKKRRARAEVAIRSLVAERLLALFGQGAPRGWAAAAAADVAGGRATPRSAAAQLMQAFRARF
jgi:LAO/AO transport system kinase